MRSDAPKRAAMTETDWPASTSLAKAVTWSAGCMAMRTTFSGSETSPGSASPDLTWQGTGWSASNTSSSTSACMALRRRPPATTAKRSLPSESGSSGRTTRFSSSPKAAIEALSAVSAWGSGGVLRTFSGASASRESGISRMSGSALGAMKFMRTSLDGVWK